MAKYKTNAIDDHSQEILTALRVQPSAFILPVQTGAEQASFLPYAKALASWSAAEANCHSALDHINMSKMVLKFMEHLLAAKIDKNGNANELRDARDEIISARALLYSAHMAYQQDCKALAAARTTVMLARVKMLPRLDGWDADSANAAWRG